MSNVIEIAGLKKYFGEVKAVDGIDFTVEQGSLFAFLGLNGAGKSTTINILCQVLPKDTGKVSIAGMDLDRCGEAIKRKIGIVFQGSILDEKLTVRDNLAIRASFYGIHGPALKRRLSELTEYLALEELLTRPYGKLSGGQRRRVDVARGLIHAPEILFLDEPTTGLDPQTRKTVWQVFDRLRAESGMTVFLTTHYMEEAATADRVVILDGGKVSACGSPVELKNRYSGDYLLVYREQAEDADAAFADEGGAFSGGCYRIPVKCSADAKRLLAKFDALIPDFEVVKGDMDDVFLNVTGKKPMEADA